MIPNPKIGRYQDNIWPSATMGNIFYTVKLNMAGKSEVLITSLLLQIETPFQSLNGVTKHVSDLDRQWATQLSAEYPKWRAITGTGDNWAICPNSSRFKFKTGLCVKLYTYGLYRQRQIATSTGKSNYFRFAIITLNLMRHDLLNTVGITYR